MADTFGRYTLLKQLGIGGMATIYLAKSTGIAGFQKLLAVKKIFPHLAESDEFIQMLVTEARIAVELSHPNICQIFDLGELDGEYFIAMEFIHGKDIFNVITRCLKTPRPLPMALACYITQQVLEALGHAHQKRDHLGQPMGIVHRDVSPRNILITYEGLVKLIDFGIAKASTVGARTQAGFIKGKLAYMSPEQARCESLDGRSDLFSAGLVLYELLHLRRLFGGCSDIATLEQVRSCRLPAFRTCNPNLPEELERILLRALAADRENRYHSASEFSRDLQHFIGGQHALVGPAELAMFMRECFSSEIHNEGQELKRFLQNDPGKPVPVPRRAARDAAPGDTDPHDISSLLEDTMVRDSSPVAPGSRASALAESTGLAPLEDEPALCPPESTRGSTRELTRESTRESTPDLARESTRESSRESSRELTPELTRESTMELTPELTPDVADPPWELATPASLDLLADRGAASSKTWLSATGDWEKPTAGPAPGALSGKSLELDLSSLPGPARAPQASPPDQTRPFDPGDPRFVGLERRLDPPSRWPTEPGLTMPGEKVYVALPRPGVSSAWSSLSAVAESPAIGLREPSPSLTRLAERRFTTLDRQTGFSRTRLASRSARPAPRRSGLASSSQFWRAVLRAVVVVIAALLIRRWLS